MISRSLLTFALALCSAVTLLPAAGSAQTPLNRATVQDLRNKVELTLKQQQSRPAHKADTMTPGDALRTYRAAMAELRFNDNSLARLGEQALFQFMPNSRNFDLRQGTVLLFITPGQGRTRVRTPNAAAGIRGSALFVRYIPDSKVTLIGALTNSNIEISNDDTCSSSQTVALKAGQLGYIFNCQIGIYNFDLKKFQETSPLFKEAKLDQNPEVKAEISQALSEQGTFAGNSESNPDWTKLAENRETPPEGRKSISPNDFASTPLRSELDSRSIEQLNSVAAAATRIPAAIVQIVQPVQPGQTVSQPTLPTVTQPIIDRPTPITTPPTPVTPPTGTPSANVPERPTPPVQVPVTPATPPVNGGGATPAIPATPATPAIPPVSGGGATPAIPATPATPATPPVVSPPTTPTVVTTPPVTTTPATPTTPVTTPVATTPVVDTPIIQPAPAPTPSTTPATTTPTTGAGGQTPAGTTRPVPVTQPIAQ